MTATLALALLLQLFAVVLLRHRLGKSWLLRPATLVVIISVVYNGVTQVMLLSPSVAAQDPYRTGIAAPFIPQAALLLAGCSLALTVAYLAGVPERSPLGAGPADVPALARALDWRVLAALDVPLAALTYSGRGYNGGFTQTSGLPVASDLAVSFFLLVTVMAAAGLVLRRGPGWILPALLIQTAVLAAAGERTPVIACGIALVAVCAHAGLRASRGGRAAAAVLIIVAVIAVGGSRYAEDGGRQVYYGDTGASGRLSALGSGLTAGAAGSQEDQIAQRLDGVSFTAAVMQSRSWGYPQLPVAGVPESLGEAVPSFLWPSKLSHTAALNPAQDEIDADELWPTNWIPGLAGTYAGFMPWPALVLLMAFLGWLAARGERRILRACTPARLVMLAGAVEAACQTDAGLPAAVVALRAAAVLAVAVRVLAALRGRRHARIAAAAGWDRQSSHQAVAWTGAGSPPR